MNLWTKTAEDYKQILYLGIDHKRKSDKLETFINNFLTKHVRITRRIMIGNNTELFQTSTNANDEYVYDIDINVNELSDDSSDLECEDFMPWFQIKKSKIENGTKDNYGLFSMWEFKKNDYLGIYFGKLIEKNCQLENKDRKAYRFKFVTCKHEDSFMDLHFMNDPLFEMYELPYNYKSEERILTEEKKETEEICIKCGA